MIRKIDFLKRGHMKTNIIFLRISRECLPKAFSWDQSVKQDFLDNLSSLLSELSMADFRLIF